MSLSGRKSSLSTDPNSDSRRIRCRRQKSAITSGEAAIRFVRSIRADSIPRSSYAAGPLAGPLSDAICPSPVPQVLPSARRPRRRAGVTPHTGRSSLLDAWRRAASFFEDLGSPVSGCQHDERRRGDSAPSTRPPPVVQAVAKPTGSSGPMCDRGEPASHERTAHERHHIPHPPRFPIRG